MDRDVFAVIVSIFFEKWWVLVVPFVVWNIVGFGNYYLAYRNLYGAEVASKLSLLKDIKVLLIVMLSVHIMILWQIVD